MEKEKSKRVTIEIPERVVGVLERVAARKTISNGKKSTISEIIRMAVNVYLKKYLEEIREQ